MSGSLRDAAEWVWYDRGMGARAVRAGLTPLAALFRSIVAHRNARFDAAAPVSVGVPALSVGNLSVGGTGKTPVASWFATQLRARGARPALVLRGYGDDEWRVHELLTPDVPVIVSPDRVVAMRAARAQGADCVVLDDAFQHRRAPRVADVVLVSADRWTGRTPVLPAGPFREPLSSLRRATAAIVTVKAAEPARIDEICTAIAAAAPSLPVAVVRLVPGALHRVALRSDGTPGGRTAATTEEGPSTASAGDIRPISTVRGVRVALISAIADGAAFERQMEGHGAQIVHHHRFPDHHAYSAGEVTAIYNVLHDAELVACTLKDAVKLAPLWPRVAPPLWYVSQTVVVDRGAEVLELECDRVLAAR